MLDNGFNVEHYDRFPHIFTRLKAARPDAQTASFVTWTPIHEHILADADRSEQWHFDGPESYPRGDAKVAETAASEIAENGPTAVVAYFGQVDGAGHKDGFHPSVPNYLAAIERADAHVGTLLAAVDARRERGEEWLVVATTDHGGRRTGHGGGHDFDEIRRVWLLVSGDGAVVGAPGRTDRHRGPRPHGTNVFRRRDRPGVGVGRGGAGVMNVGPS